MTNAGVVFDYRALRLLVGFIALAMPFLVSAISTTSLTSVSASYYTEARDTFVGMLFVVAAFLWAYNGHQPPEGRASKAASLLAMLVALFPTSCDSCQASMVSVIHYVAAAVFFLILAYFCFGPLRQHTRGQPGKKRRRDTIYIACGSVMVACMVAAAVAYLMVPEETRNTWSVTYWAEATALGAFGVAWIVASKALPPFVDEDERLYLFRQAGDSR